MIVNLIYTGKMPKPLTPTSSQEIIAISPPISFRSKTNDPKNGNMKGIPFGITKPDAPSQSKTISHMSNYASSSRPTPSSTSNSSSSTTLPNPITFQPNAELRGKIIEHVKADKYLQQIGHVPTPGDKFNSRLRSGKDMTKDKGKRKEREEEVERERKRLLCGNGDGEGSRERTTQRMVCVPSIHKIICIPHW